MSWAISVEPVVMYQARCAEIECDWSPEPSWHESEARELAETHWRDHDDRWRRSDEAEAERRHEDEVAASLARHESALNAMEDRIFPQDDGFFD